MVNFCSRLVRMYHDSCWSRPFWEPQTCWCVECGGRSGGCGGVDQTLLCNIIVLPRLRRGQLPGHFLAFVPQRRMRHQRKTCNYSSFTKGRGTVWIPAAAAQCMIHHPSSRQERQLVTPSMMLKVCDAPGRRSKRVTTRTCAPCSLHDPGSCG